MLLIFLIFHNSKMTNNKKILYLNLTLNLKNMKYPNYLISSLAVVGAFSLIIMACSADSSNSTNGVNSLGKYQLSTDGNIHVIDTETGVVKTYKYSNSTNNYVYQCTTSTQP